MRRLYIHQLPGWPSFHWDHKALETKVAAVRHRQGILLGRMAALGFENRNQANLENLTLDVVKSSEIEGEILDVKKVRSSIAHRLGIDIGGLLPEDRNIESVVQLTLDATQNFNQPLSKERLWGWHAALFPTGYSGLYKIKVGTWRDDAQGPMQVVSGPIGHERVHFEAPSAERLAQEMETFMAWVNQTDEIDPALKSAIAHLWFVTIHPFDDGNGRIGRAIADWVLARAEKSAQRFYSMSAEIRKRRKTYYEALENANTLDITAWLTWFLDCLAAAFETTETTLANVFRKASFWKIHAATPLNERQHLIINKLLTHFDGKLNSSKWAKLSKCSQDTAQRDINDLIARKILVKDAAGGRSTSYSLVADL